MENVNEIATALIEAQKEMGGAKKDANNPFFKSKYADLNSIIEAVKGPLLNNGISFIQPMLVEGGNNFVKTILVHKSGQTLESTMLIKPTKDDMQGLGSAITYARRYTLQAMCGLPAEDDDGNAASSPVVKKPEPQVVPPKEEVPITEYPSPMEPTAAGGTSPLVCMACQAEVSAKVKQYSMDKFGKTLCFDCQKVQNG